MLGPQAIVWLVKLTVPTRRKSLLVPTWTSTTLPWSSSATALGPPVSYWMLGPQAIVWLVKLTVPTR